MTDLEKGKSLNNTEDVTLGRAASFTTVINNVRIPLPDYPEGSDGPASVDGSTTCVAFAKLVYKRAWGSYTYGTVGTKQETDTAEKASSLLGNLTIGARITGYPKSGDSHTMILVERTAYGIRVYNSNWTPGNKVSFNWWTYTQYSERFLKTNYYNPN